MEKFEENVMLYLRNIVTKISHMNKMMNKLEKRVEQLFL